MYRTKVFAWIKVAIFNAAIKVIKSEQQTHTLSPHANITLRKSPSSLLSPRQLAHWLIFSRLCAYITNDIESITRTCLIKNRLTMLPALCNFWRVAKCKWIHHVHRDHDNTIMYLVRCITFSALHKSETSEKEFPRFKIFIVRLQTFLYHVCLFISFYSILFHSKKSFKAL